MRIALIGHGKMGQAVERLAVARGHTVARRFTDIEPLRVNDAERRALEGVSVLVDFSTADAVLDNVRAAAALGIPLVEGTTGWQEQWEEARRLVSASGIAMVAGANFSLGVNLFYRIVERAAQVFSTFSQYEPFVEEAHHKFKKDSPSGTALELVRLLRRAYPDVSMPVASLRAGHIPGSHSVGFDSPADTVRLEHVARNREGLAEGAMFAAKWVIGKTGFHAFPDIIDKLVTESLHEKK